MSCFIIYDITNNYTILSLYNYNHYEPNLTVCQIPVGEMVTYGKKYHMNNYNSYF